MTPLSINWIIKQSKSLFITSIRNLSLNLNELLLLVWYEKFLFPHLESQTNLYCFNRSSLPLLFHIPLTNYLSFLSVLLQINLQMTKEGTLHIPPNQNSVISYLFLSKFSKTFFQIAVTVVYSRFINFFNKSFASSFCLRFSSESLKIYVREL